MHALNVRLLAQAWAEDLGPIPSYRTKGNIMRNTCKDGSCIRMPRTKVARIGIAVRRHESGLRFALAQHPQILISTLAIFAYVELWADWLCRCEQVRKG
jgi:hypothetical protein